MKDNVFFEASGLLTHTHFPLAGSEETWMKKNSSSRSDEEGATPPQVGSKRRGKTGETSPDPSFTCSAEAWEELRL